ncbi:MAG: succinate dehydrogenase, cytochrome b556 subunit [Gammaproteobacteria bacterium]|nr:succinate dehydrogenase, cytochrome b556 subunit [Gammaproteobacteria bacterium]
MNNKRPVFLNLLKIHLPITGVTSILHRLSGIILFLMVPFSLYLLQLSIESVAAFKQVLVYLSLPAVKIVLILGLWSFTHHLFAGFRFLLIDQNIGVSLAAARKSAWIVAYGAVAVTIGICGVWLL